ncbi:cupin domain-containing protein [Paraglaciecola sp. 20A4]|uniref:cupin domain-containing protein n=1 Tax=Paraglaciecola sp. 20A4 TaxID=2687288 RepID=UPI001409DCE5|nr:cupin domain-containing protein [Paraglaciecola sp. 20A4]
MKKKILSFLLTGLTCLLSGISTQVLAENESQVLKKKEDVLQTQVVTRQQAQVSHYDGAVFYNYFMGDTAGSTGAIAGMAVIEPGYEIHPPHEHIDEEYLTVVSGNGQWSVNGKTFPANTGDMIYVAPNDSHGIFNSGKIPLVFVVSRWKSQQPLGE